MKAICTFLFMIAYGMITAQTVSNLERDNGFQDIHLLEDIDSVKEFISIFKDPDIDKGKFDFAMYESQYSYNGSGHAKFAGAGIKKIFLSTTQGYVSEIKVICEHDSSVISALTKMYGQPVTKFRTVIVEDKKAERSIGLWQSENIRLAYTAKKYLRKKDSDEAEVSDFMYLKYSLINPEKSVREKYKK